MSSAPQNWDPGHYLKFQDLRLRPALDLLARVPLADIQRFTDLGCGAGTVTPYLCKLWQNAWAIGLDSSAEMLHRADACNPGLNVHWQQGDIADWSAPQPQDLIFSNAVLHWLDGHQNLFPQLMRQLAPGGVLAVQMPNQFAEPSHTLMREAAFDGPWAEVLKPLLREAPVARMGDYYDWLSPMAASVEIWETTYAQILDGEDAVLDWIGSTALKPLLEALDQSLRDEFKAVLAAKLRKAYPQRQDGSTLFPFRRMFMVAVVPA
ncbi:MAG: methyltransferase domain-containing protein [Magnetovibrio sp.]|nr:methyltransferase domain-containing protein [Magnetovibrio sp.]